MVLKSGFYSGIDIGPSTPVNPNVRSNFYEGRVTCSSAPPGPKRSAPALFLSSHVPEGKKREVRYIREFVALIDDVFVGEGCELLDTRDGNVVPCNRTSAILSSRGDRGGVPLSFPAACIAAFFFIRS